MSKRAPRLGDIEIPLTLTTLEGQSVACSCLNVSQTGALLMFDHSYPIQLGMEFKSKMLRQGKRVCVRLRVERIGADGVGVHFIDTPAMEA